MGGHPLITAEEIPEEGRSMGVVQDKGKTQAEPDKSFYLHREKVNYLRVIFRKPLPKLNIWSGFIMV